MRISPELLDTIKKKLLTKRVKFYYGNMKPQCSPTILDLPNEAKVSIPILVSKREDLDTVSAFDMNDNRLEIEKYYSPDHFSSVVVIVNPIKHFLWTIKNWRVL